MMLTHSKALWRIDYRTDLTRSNGLVLPVGFVLEARWNNNVRWLGMLFRKRLTPKELDLVNVETWPEMKGLEPFMNKVFEDAWAQEIEIGDGSPALGSDVIAARFSMQSSLQFIGDAPKIELSETDAEESFTGLYTRLLGLHDNLSPALLAPVVELPRRSRWSTPVPVQKPQRADVEQVLRAA
jgi:hypothetical protein